MFVHGLGGNSRATWCKNKDPELFWPLKFLPLEPGLGDVRILTFGYNAHFQPGSGNNKKSISDFSEELLDGMKHGQDDTAEEDEALGFGAVGHPSRLHRSSTITLDVETHHLCGPFHGWSSCKRGISLSC